VNRRNERVWSKLVADGEDKEDKEDKEEFSFQPTTDDHIRSEMIESVLIVPTSIATIGR